MIERINPFQFSTFGYYSQGVKIDLGTKTMILVAGQLALKEDGTPVAPGDFTAQKCLDATLKVFQVQRVKVRVRFAQKDNVFRGHALDIHPCDTTVLDCLNCHRCYYGVMGA